MKWRGGRGNTIVLQTKIILENMRVRVRACVSSHVTACTLCEYACLALSLPSGYVRQRTLTLHTHRLVLYRNKNNFGRESDGSRAHKARSARSRSLYEVGGTLYAKYITRANSCLPTDVFNADS